MSPYKLTRMLLLKVPYLFDKLGCKCVVNDFVYGHIDFGQTFYMNAVDCCFMYKIHCCIQVTVIYANKFLSLQ